MSEDYIKREDAEEAVDIALERFVLPNREAVSNRLHNQMGALSSADVVSREDYESMEHTVAKLNKALADVEPVVRCKDCKYSTPCDNEEYPYACDYDFPMSEQRIWVQANDYCSHGKSKDGDDNVQLSE